MAGRGEWDGVDRRAVPDAYTQAITDLATTVGGYTETMKAVVGRLDGIEKKVGAIRSYPDDHDDFVALLVEREKRRVERSEKIKAQVGGWAIIVALGGMGTGAWHLAKEFVHTGAK